MLEVQPIQLWRGGGHMFRCVRLGESGVAWRAKDEVLDDLQTRSYPEMACRKSNGDLLEEDFWLVKVGLSGVVSVMTDYNSSPATPASRIRPSPASVWGCRDRHLSKARENPYKRRALGRGRHRLLLPANFSTAGRSHEPPR